MIWLSDEGAIPQNRMLLVAVPSSSLCYQTHISTRPANKATGSGGKVMPPSLVQSAAQRVWTSFNNSSFRFATPPGQNSSMSISPLTHDLTTISSATTQTVAATVESVNSNFPLALASSILAGASTGLGGLLAVLQRDLSVRKLGIWQGAAAGFLLSVSIFDLGPTILKDIDVFPAFVFFCIGGMIFALLKQYIPEPDMDVLSKANDDASTTREVLWSGLLTAAGISLHNFPEGVAVCVASLRGLEFGLPVAIAIGLHLSLIHI